MGYIISILRFVCKLKYLRKCFGKMVPFVCTLYNKTTIVAIYSFE